MAFPQRKRVVRPDPVGDLMKLIAFINDVISITKILTHLGEAVEAPKMQRARPPPEVYQVENEIEGYLEPEYHYDQTLNW